MKTMVTSPSGKVREVRNLGWLIRNARRGVKRVLLKEAANHGAQLTAEMSDGSVFTSECASFSVMLSWVHRPVLMGCRLVVEHRKANLLCTIERPCAQVVLELHKAMQPGGARSC